MSDQMPHDEELRAAYRRLPADEPRAEIDDAILAAARRRSEVDARRRLLRQIRWTVPLAAAAGVVLTMTLTRLTPEQGAVVQPGVALDERATTAAPAGEAAGSAPADSLARQEAVGDDRANRDRSQVPAVEGEAKKAEAAKPAPERREAAEADAARAQAAPVAKPAPLAQRAPLAQPAAPAAPAPLAKERLRAAAPSEAAKPAAPPPAAIGAMSAPKAESMPQPEAAPGDAAKSSGALGSLGSLRGEDPAPLTDSDLAMMQETPGEAALADKESDEWPFALEPGLGAAEACRRLVLAVGDRCEFKGNVAIVFPEGGTVVDHGKFAGRKTTRITLTLRDGELWSVGLKVNSYREEQVLLPPGEK